MPQNKTIEIFDTTLRDGGQTPGVSFTPSQKLRIAKLLDSLGVNVIEFGFPRSNSVDIQTGQKLSKMGLKAELCALAMPTTRDVDLVLQSGAQRINFFVPCSKIQSNAMGGVTPLNNALKTIAAVKYAREKGLKVEVTMMDAVRAEPRFLRIFAKQLEKAGAQMLTLSDTVGSLDPFKTRQLFRNISRSVKIPLSAHEHDDRHNAVANSLAAVMGGAKQVHVTIGGLGDRAGNASLEAVALNLKDLLGKNTSIKEKRIGPTALSISRLGKFKIPENAAFTGWRSRTHSSGLHISAPKGFEAIDPARIGLKREILYGTGSDKRVVEMLAQKVHQQLTPDQVENFVRHLKNYGNRGIVLRQTTAEKLLKKKVARRTI